MLCLCLCLFICFLFHLLCFCCFGCFSLCDSVIAVPQVLRALGPLLSYLLLPGRHASGNLGFGGLLPFRVRCLVGCFSLGPFLDCGGFSRDGLDGGGLSCGSFHFGHLPSCQTCGAAVGFVLCPLGIIVVVFGSECHERIGLESKAFRFHFESDYVVLVSDILCGEGSKSGDLGIEDRSLSLEASSFFFGHLPSVQTRGAAVSFVFNRLVLVGLVRVVGFSDGSFLRFSGLRNGGVDCLESSLCCSQGTVSFGVGGKLVCGFGRVKWLVFFPLLFLLLLLLFFFVCGSRFVISVFAPLAVRTLLLTLLSIAILDTLSNLPINTLPAVFPSRLISSRLILLLGLLIFGLLVLIIDWRHRWWWWWSTIFPSRLLPSRLILPPRLLIPGLLFLVLVIGLFILGLLVLMIGWGDRQRRGCWRGCRRRCRRRNWSWRRRWRWSRCRLRKHRSHRGILLPLLPRRSGRRTSRSPLDSHRSLRVREVEQASRRRRRVAVASC